MSMELIEIKYVAYGARRLSSAPERSFASGKGVDTHLTPTNCKRKTADGLLTSLTLQKNSMV